jgi:putative ABC transport system permease protein
VRGRGRGGARGGRRNFEWPWRDRARIGAEVDEEIAFHLDMRVRELVERGVDAGAARRQAELEFGDVAGARAELVAADRRHERRRSWRERAADGARDVRIAGRSLRRSPGFTAVAVATLALGIGATTALFSVVDGVLLKPLPYAAPERLVAVSPAVTLLRAEYALLRERARLYVAVAGYQGGVGLGIAGAGEPVRVVGALASPELFGTLGVAPALGRGFVPEDERAGAEAVVVLSDGLWRELYGGAANAVGEVLAVDGVARTVVGVMPAGFTFPAAGTQLWVPLTLDPAQVGTYWGLGGVEVVARLAPGADREAARREFVALAAEMRQANPLWTPNEPYRADATVAPLAERVVLGARPALLVLLGATALVLLIACANVANLFLVRVLGREHDLAVRAALGGGRLHVVRGIVAEAGVVAGCGGAAALLVAWLVLRLLLPLLPPETPRLEQVALDGRVLLFALAATAGAALLFAVLPALRLGGGRLAGALRAAGREGGAGRERRRLTRLVVAAEIALAVVLLLGAGLLVRSLAELAAVDPGFRAAGLVAARVSPPERLLPDGASRSAFHDRVLERLARLAGTGEVALAGQLPFDGERLQTAAAVEHVTTDPNALPVFDFRPVTPAYFSTLGVPLLEGRAFDAGDRAGAPGVAIVDEAAARRFWPGESALGKRVGRPWLREWLTVVGVAAQVRNNDLVAEPAPALYVPFAQQPAAAVTVVVRSPRPAEEVAALIRNAVREVDPTVPVSGVRRVEALVGDSVAGARSLALLLSAFAGLALLLGALGVYGVLAYTVERRHRELGVRMALGATAGQVRRLVLRDGALLVLAGLALGAPLALVATRALRGLLYGVQPLDAAAVAAAVVGLGAAGLLAAYVPARRASRVDPAGALRRD